MSNIIDDELLDLIRKTTRAVQFNFDEVAKIVNSALSSDEEDGKGKRRWGELLPLTPQQCREIFAIDYNQTMKPSQRIEVDTFTTPPATAVAASAAVTATRKEEESLSYDEILRQHEELKKQNHQKMNEVFQRVLGALETTEKVTLDENDEVVLAQKQRIETQEIERQRKALFEEEQRELEAFEIQRAKLKKRFDIDSEDAEGIDPLSQKSQCMSMISKFL